MPAILHKLPFFDRETTVEAQGQSCRVLTLQIVVWVSLTVRGIRQFDKRTPRFPAVLDTGFTDSFLIHPSHLRRFAGLRPEQLRRRQNSLRSHGRLVPLHAANLWLHPNKSNERDTASGRLPVLLEVDRGIAIPTDQEIYPRLPLLGARALRDGELHVAIDYARCLLSLRTRRKFWFFG